MSAKTDNDGVRRPGRPRNPVPREELLSTAVTAFAEQGYNGTSLDYIAGEAGIRKSSLLHRFGSKEALYLESLASVLGKLGELVDAAAGGTDTFAERLDRLSLLITEYLYDEPRAAPLLMREIMNRGPFFSGVGGPLFAQVLGTARGFVEQGAEAGEFDISDPGDTVISIAGLHLTYFAVHELSEQFFGQAIFSPEAKKRRCNEVILQVRRLCGLT